VLLLAKQPAGSHVIEAFVRSEALAKFKQGFVKNIKVSPVTTLSLVTPSAPQPHSPQGQIPDLAMHKVGSRVIESCYLALDVTEKQWMVQELVDSEDSLSQNFFGRLVLRKCRVQAFRQGGQAAWQAQVESSENVKGMFGDILNTDEDFFGGGDSKSKGKKDKKKKGKEDGNDSDADIDALMSTVKAESKKKKQAGQDEGEDAEEVPKKEKKETKDKKEKKTKKADEDEEGESELPGFIADALDGLNKKTTKKKKRETEDEDGEAVKREKKKKKKEGRKFES
jgi:hypothetical protein